MIDRSLNYGRHLIEHYLLSAPASAVIVDIGAGSGTDLAIAREKHPGARLHAIECWPPNVEALRQQGIAVHALNIERDTLPMEAGSVDVVIANQVLEHTKEIFWIFHEVSRILKKNGSFIIGVPNLASLHNRLLLMCGRQPSPIKSASAHVRGFTAPDLIHFVNACFPGGYRLDGLGGSNFYPFPAAPARFLAKVFPTMAWGIFLRFTKRADYSRQFVDFPRNERLETNFYVGSGTDALPFGSERTS
jgi:SAM-dependent methyltransferase